MLAYNHQSFSMAFVLCLSDSIAYKFYSKFWMLSDFISKNTRLLL